MFIKNPILSGVGLMLTCLIAFMAQASFQYNEESRLHYQSYVSTAEAQEVIKETAKNKQSGKKKICAKIIQQQQKEIADKLKAIKKQLKKLKK